MSNYQPDPNPEAEGIPDMHDAPPGRDIDTNEEGFMVPRDYPIAVGEDETYAVTAADERVQETVAERRHREEPDVGETVGVDGPLGGQLFEPDSGTESGDLTPEEVALVSEDQAQGMTVEEQAMRVGSEDIADDLDPAIEAAEYLEGR
jgi:hypothetical protein